MDVIPAPVLVFAGLAAVGGLVYTQCSKPQQRAKPAEIDLDDIEPETKKSKKNKKAAAGPTQPEKKPVKVVAKAEPTPEALAQQAKKEKKAAAAAAEEARRAEQKQKAEEAKKAAEAKRIAEAEKAAAAKKAEEAKKASEAKKAAEQAKKQAKKAPAPKTEEQIELEKLRAELAALKAGSPVAAAPAAAAPAAGKKGKGAAAAAAPAAAAPAAAADNGLNLTEAEIEEQQAELAAFADEWHVVAPIRRKKKAAPQENTPAAPKVPEGPAKVTVEVKVAAADRGVILGRSGETLKRITELTGADVKIPKSEAPNDPVQITGTAEQVAEAKQAIQELVKRGFSSLLDPSMSEIKVKVPANRRVAVLGTKGANVKKIQEATGVRINFPDRTSMSEFVQVVGDKDACTIAKTAIESLVSDGYSAITHEDYIKVEVDFPFKYRSKLIGVRGEYIKSLEFNTKCRFSFPEGDADVVVVVGPAGNIAQAERAVRRLQEKLDTPVVEVAADGFDEEEYEDDEAW